jgi:cyclopropane-fatty-acyl-phospholipid synthase
MNTLARRIVHALLGRILTGTLTVVENDREIVFGRGAGGPHARVVVNSPAAWPLLLKGSSGLGEAYARGLWDCDDLTALIRVAAVNTAELDEWRRRLTPLRAPFQRLRSARNTVQQSKRDISAHYDLGNRLYELMLDPTMSYSSAYFAEPGMTLEDASLAKLELVCEKLDLGPGDHVVEIGTGWGGFAVHAATTRGCRVTTTTISREQFEHARARVRDAGVGHLVEVLDRDYRTLEGSYDKLVSIEMIEAVGWRDFGTFFEQCAALLKPDGAMLLQAITMDDRAYHVEKASRSFIRTYIFPNGCLPSVEVIARCAARTDLRLTGMHDLTAHYPETLRRWRANVEANAAELQRLGYDERFRRIWRLYLAYCEAGFTERRISVLQIGLAKPRHRPGPDVQPALHAAVAAPGSDAGRAAGGDRAGRRAA